MIFSDINMEILSNYKLKDLVERNVWDLAVISFGMTKNAIILSYTELQMRMKKIIQKNKNNQQDYQFK